MARGGAMVCVARPPESTPTGLTGLVGLGHLVDILAFRPV